ncbi:uncharacterized protein LOC129742636 [Uranotaenia lowii]|uniref:uncharacterized protein LOC129742636 n=1 Tax=Uranotaenia lowii TaxID=190385 RepID=UPI002478CDB2|nr:uncharacterized protein LOC129742636 [Uranotaenia lowii]
MPDLQAIYDEYNEIHNAIIEAVPEDAEAQEEKFIEFEEAYNEASIKIEILMDVLQKDNQRTPANPVVAPMPLAGQVIVNTQSYRAPLPTFDGRYEAWPRFKAMFQDLMERTNDSDAVKLYHLENSLKGEAAGVIDIETLQNNHYERAWEILEQRFGNKRLILESHILGLLNMTKVQRKSSKELRNLVDECTRHIDNLVKLDQPLTGMSLMFVVTLLARALDDQTRELWEASFDQTELPQYDDMIKFLRQRVVILERCETATTAGTSKTSKFAPFKGGVSKSSHAAIATSENACDFCNGQHKNDKCPIFVGINVQKRWRKLREMKLCYNCLQNGHQMINCPSKGVCGKCFGRHHTLLHFLRDEPSKSVEGRQRLGVTERPVNASCSSVNRQPRKQIFLMTALVNLQSKGGQVHKVRALLDSGSQVNLLTESLVRKLNLPKYPTNMPVVGVGGTRSQIRHRVAVRMSSNYNDFDAIVDCLVTPRVTGTIPSTKVNVDTWHLTAGMVLADPRFNEPNDVEMLIGAEYFHAIMLRRKMHLAEKLPILLETQFGWVVTGSYEEDDGGGALCANFAVVDSLEVCLKRFFHQEELTEPETVTTEEERFEEHFQRTYRRNEDGRFVVQLPFCESVSHLEGSRSLPSKRNLIMEKNLLQNPDLREYQTLGHCREVKEDDDPPGLQAYILSHHCILKPSSCSTNLRVVFDGTAKATAFSLNDSYMDDRLSGSETVDSTKKLSRHQETLMLKGGFPIRKWCSNSEDVLEGIPDADREILVPIQDSCANEVIKALGLLWDPKRDLFLFHKSPEQTKDDSQPTKRKVLSQTARLFDLSGLVSPVSVEAKMIMQSLWAANIGWDDPVKSDLLHRWEEFQKWLTQLGKLEVPRCVVAPETKTMEIHGFADASKHAYGACVYLRSIAHCKSKVALFEEGTVPKLELWAVQLLVKLAKKVILTLKLKIEVVKLWSYSQMVLAWLKNALERLEVCFRNRVAEIVLLADDYQSGYINTAHNPADIMSRGVPSFQDGKSSPSTQARI